MNLVIRLTCTVSLLLVACGETKSPPHDMIDLAFYKCEKSHNLHGGIFGKGPTKRFGPKVSRCSKNEWTKISKGEFKTLASEWYGHDWSKEGFFWRRVDR